jgi:hypothetical protein
MRSRSASLVAAVAALVIGSVAPAGAQQGDRVYTAPRLPRPLGEARVVLIPAAVHLYELTATGAEPKADWTATAKTHIDAALAAHLGTKVASVTPYALPTREHQAEHIQVLKLHGLVVRAIFAHYLNPHRQLPNKAGAFDWSLGETARVLPGEPEADYALFTQFADAYSSGGRVAMNVVAAVFGGVIQTGRQVILGTLVDLATGDIVWLNYHTDASSDLRTPDSAAKAVSKLLRDLPR